MNNQYVFESNDLIGEVSVKLKKNQFSENENYYGIVSRRTASPDNLYKQMQKALPEMNRGTIYTVCDSLVTQTLEMLAKGYAVNFFGLGIFRIAANGTTDSKTGKLPLTVKFTPSEQTKLSVQNVQITESVYLEQIGFISSITDIKTGNTDLTLSSGGAVLIQGEKLKIGGDECGVWLANLTENEKLTEDESNWIKIDSAFIYNTQGKLMFTLPNSLVSGSKYRFVLRSHCSNWHTTKTLVETTSDVVTIL